MTPQQKAQQLIDKFENATPSESVLIAVDEIIRHTYMGKSKSANDQNSFEYWEEVKEEILNLL